MHRITCTWKQMGQKVWSWGSVTVILRIPHDEPIRPQSLAPNPGTRGWLWLKTAGPQNKTKQNSMNLRKTPVKRKTGVRERKPKEGDAERKQNVLHMYAYMHAHMHAWHQRTPNNWEQKGSERWTSPPTCKAHSHIPRPSRVFLFPSYGPLPINQLAIT